MSGEVWTQIGVFIAAGAGSAIAARFMLWRLEGFFKMLDEDAE